MSHCKNIILQRVAKFSSQKAILKIFFPLFFVSFFLGRTVILRCKKTMVILLISHLHPKLFLGLKSVAFLNPSRHRKCEIDKRELMSISGSDVAAMSSVLKWLKTLNRFGGLRFGKKKPLIEFWGKTLKTWGFHGYPICTKNFFLV